MRALRLEPATAGRARQRRRAARPARERAGRDEGERLARELEAARDLRPRTTPSRVAAFALACAVHLVSVGLVVVGVVVAVAGGLALEPLLLGLLAIAAGVLLHPRIPRIDRSHALSAERAPALHALAGEVARSVGARAPDVVSLVPEYTAYWAVGGLRRRRQLALGLPLLAVLEPPQRVALVAHEVAHEVNGDARRGLVVGSALQTLAALHRALGPGGGVFAVDADSAIAALAAPLANLLLALLRAPVRALYELETHLLLADSRRAEYLADALAAETAGTPAVVGLHETLLLGSAYELVVQRAALANERGDGLLARVREAFAGVPERERERRRRVARLEGSRLDSTHPPTGMRIALLERRDARPPRVRLDPAANERLEREIDALAPPLEREIVDQRRARLYHG